jgi:hypothetical protein
VQIAAAPSVSAAPPQGFCAGAPFDSGRGAARELDLVSATSEAGALSLLLLLSGTPWLAFYDAELHLAALAWCSKRAAGSTV